MINIRLMLLTPFVTVMGFPCYCTCRWSKLCIIDLHALSDAIFFGLGNLELKIVAMSYEMSL